MTGNIIYLIGNAFRVYIYWKLVNVLFQNSKVKNIWIIFGFLIYYIINSTASIMFSNSTLNIITNIIPLIALTFLYQTKISSKIFVALAFYAVNMMADAIMYALIMIIDDGTVIISSGIGTVLFTFLLELIFEYVLRKRIHHELDIIHFLTILTVPLGSILIGILTMSKYDIKVVVVSLILILFNIMVFYLYDRLQKNYETIYEKRMLEQAIKAKNTELEIMKESQDKISFLRHDFKNHLISIEKYAENNDCSGVINYIKSAFDFLQINSQLVYTGNFDIDSIINYKLQEMNKKDIDAKYSITIPNKLNIKDFDLNIILGNLLNNAMEAMEKTEKKHFFLDISFDKNVLFIHMENTYHGVTNKKNSEFFTTKSDKQIHGIGLKSIENVLEKYNGDIIFTHDNEVFKTDVMICNVYLNGKTCQY